MRHDLKANEEELRVSVEEAGRIVREQEMTVEEEEREVEELERQLLSAELAAQNQNEQETKGRDVREQISEVSGS